MAEFYVRAAKPAEITSALNQHSLLTKPGFHPHMCRVGILEGAVISYAVTGRSVLLYGRRWLRVAGLGRLYMLPPFRDQGYGLAMVEDTITYMREQGAHLAIVRDETGMFDRFGFSPLWPEYYMSFDAAQASHLQSPYRVQTPQPNHLPQMAALYEKHWGSRVTFRRVPELWWWRFTEDPARQVLVALNQDDAVTGYISGYHLLDDEIEVITDDPLAAAALMAETGRRALAAGRETVRWLVPPDDALVLFARDLLEIVLSAYYHPSSGWMGRIIDTNALINAILPELLAQAAATWPEFEPAALTLNAGPTSMNIRYQGERSAECSLSYRDFIQLLFGSLTPHALAFREAIHPDALLLLQALFPPRIAALGHWDWF